MPLINCPDCGHQVSDQAPACPQCGRPINTAIVQQAPAPAPVVTPQQVNPQAIGAAVSDPLIEHNRRSSSGGAIGALIGAVLGYFLMASQCGMPDDGAVFTMSLFFWSPVIGLGMLLGYFLGKAVS